MGTTKWQQAYQIFLGWYLVEHVWYESRVKAVKPYHKVTDENLNVWRMNRYSHFVI